MFSACFSRFFVARARARPRQSERKQQQAQQQAQPQAQPQAPQFPESLQSPALTGPPGRAVEAWDPPVNVGRAAKTPAATAGCKVKTEELQPSGGAVRTADVARATGGAAGSAGSAGAKDAAGTGVKAVRPVRPKSEEGAYVPT